jgi:hypothetical protein
MSLKKKIADLGAMLHRCPCLRTISLSFRGITPESTKATLTSLESAPGASVCLLDICIHATDRVSATRFTSLLSAATGVSPHNLVLTRAPDFDNVAMALIEAELPYFNSATSIKLSLPNICFTQLPADKFLALRKLSLSGCRIVDLATLITRCQRLHALTLMATESTSNITVHSATLQELYVNANTECQSINIVTPALKELILTVDCDANLSISVRRQWWSRFSGGALTWRCLLCFVFGASGT